jgi:hypothetical protein
LSRGLVRKFEPNLNFVNLAQQTKEIHPAFCARCIKKGIVKMKLPPFSEFVHVKNDEKYAPKYDFDICSLPEEERLTPDRVYAHAERTAERKTMLTLERYHNWLSEQLNLE